MRGLVGVLCGAIRNAWALRATLVLLSATVAGGASAQQALPLLAGVAPNAATVIGGYYEETSAVTSLSPPTPATCANPGPSGCIFVFSPVPQGKQLIVTKVSCWITSQQTVIESVSPVLMTSQRARATPSKNGQVFKAEKTASNDYTVSQSTLQLIDQQSRPLIEVIVSPQTGITVIGLCTIAGQLINAPK